MKRDGTIIDFNRKKIFEAIEKAFLAVSVDDETIIKILAQSVVDELEQNIEDDQVLTVEDIQDVVEKILITEGHAKVAKAYILYRQRRSEARKLKSNILGQYDDSKLDVNGLLICKSRYLIKNKDGQTIETPTQMFRRVAKAMASVERHYDKTKEQIDVIEEEFFEILESLDFIPSGRILANSGTKNKMIYSSFVLPIEDSMKGVFRALYHKALVQRLGGGTGFSFSRLRPKGSSLSSTIGKASGPISFIKLFDHASDLTVMGGRRPANMGSLSVDHPDIIEFITMKDRGEIRNFNISVEITDEFMEAVKNNEKYSLRDPNTGAVVEEVDANNIFHLIVTMAWKTGDPGILFIDRINESNPLPNLARIETTDPCGDQLLFPYDGGNLGAINLSNFVRYNKIKWKQLEQVVRLSVRFLDNVVDYSDFPIKKIKDMVLANRRIGLGIMGFADMLYKLRIPYNSDKAIETGAKIMKFIAATTYEYSGTLAKEKGVFPLWDQSIFFDDRPLRNCSLLAVAPTGSRSILAETSAGIEPNFALGYTRKVLGSVDILQLNKVLEDVLKEHDIHSDELIREIVRLGTVEDIDVPQAIKEVFVTAHKIDPEWHLKMQSVFQRYIDNAISKTINFPKSATIEQIRSSFMRAYELRCKGVTVYREGSLNNQVINIGQ